MKKVIVSLVVFFSLSLLAGCANQLSVGPVSVSDETAVVEVRLNLEKVGVLSKVTAIDKPTMLLAVLLPDYKYDTIMLSGSGPISLRYVLKKGYSYEILLSAASQVGLRFFNLNSKNFSFTVPADKDTFPLNLTVPAVVSKLDLQIPLKGSPVAALARSIKVTWTTDNVYFDSSVLAFNGGSLDTAKLEGVMAVNRGYSVTVVIECSDGSYYKGSGSVTPSPSVDSNLDIPLTKYDPNGTVVLTNILLSKVAVVTTRVVWP